jgi:hypothetical protein
MGKIGDIWADFGIHVNAGSFAAGAAAIKATETAAESAAVKTSSSLAASTAGFYKAEQEINKFSMVTKGAIAGLLVLPAVTLGAIAAYGVKLASGFETAATTLTNLYKSSDIAREKFTWMREFAAKTPFNFDELLATANQMKGMGLDFQKYVQSIGDASASLGKSAEQGTNAFIGAVMGRFVRLKEFGIQAYQVTKNNWERLGADEKDIGKEALIWLDGHNKQRLNIVDKYNKLEIASNLDAIWNEKYAGAMAARSATLQGLYSNLKDNLSYALSDAVGYDMDQMQVKSYSLYNALKVLTAGAISLTGAYLKLSPEMKGLITIAALSIAGIGLVAAGMIAAAAASTLLAGVGLGSLVSVLGAAAVLFAEIVIPIGLVAVGLIYLEQKTGLVSKSWQVAKDMGTVFFDWLSRGASTLKTGIVNEFNEIKAAVLDIIPQSAIDKVTDFYNWASGILGDKAAWWHSQAEGIRGDKARSAGVEDHNSQLNNLMTGTGFGTAPQKITITADTSQAQREIKTLDDLVNSIPLDAEQATDSLTPTGDVDYSGTVSGLQETDTQLQNTTSGSQQLAVSLTDTGNISFGGTTGQIMLTNAAGVSTKLTISQLMAYLQQSGNVSQAGSAGQLMIVKANGEQLNITTNQAAVLLKNVNNTSLSNQISQVSSIGALWKTANANMNSYASAAISQRKLEKTYEQAMKESVSTGQSANGVTVVGKGQPIKSTNVVSNTYNTYNQPTASDKNTRLKIIGRS